MIKSQISEAQLAALLVVCIYHKLKMLRPSMKKAFKACFMYLYVQTKLQQVDLQKFEKVNMSCCRVVLLHRWREKQQTRRPKNFSMEQA